MTDPKKAGDTASLVERLEFFARSFDHDLPDRAALIREAASALILLEKERDDRVPKREYDEMFGYYKNAEARAERAEAERDAAIGHLTAVLDRWDAVLPFVQSAEGIAYVHSWRYMGPEGGMPVVTDSARTFLESVTGEKRG